MKPLGPWTPFHIYDLADRALCTVIDVVVKRCVDCGAVVKWPCEVDEHGRCQECADFYTANEDPA